MIDCFNYFRFGDNSKILEIEILGNIMVLGGKTSTNKIKILREVSMNEVMGL